MMNSFRYGNNVNNKPFYYYLKNLVQIFTLSAFLYSFFFRAFIRAGIKKRGRKKLLKELSSAQ